MDVFRESSLLCSDTHTHTPSCCSSDLVLHHQHILVHQWLWGKVPDLQSGGCMFEPRPGLLRTTIHRVKNQVMQWAHFRAPCSVPIGRLCVQFKVVVYTSVNSFITGMPGCCTPKHFRDKTIYTGINYNFKLYTQMTNGPKMVPGSELIAWPGF